MPISLITCHFNKIYNFGDSISDTGNLIREKPIGAATAEARLPYGETFFKHATGRCSNGRLMIDFIAHASGLPFLNPPYLNKDANFTHAVNFAVAGATALPAKVLAKKNIADPVTNSSLPLQLDWMSKHFNSTCIIGRDCSEKEKTSLFLLGEIGVNDYNYPSIERKTIQEIENLVPEVVAAIISGVKRVINAYGAVRVVVPSIFPNGCFPLYLTLYQTNDSSAYDKHGYVLERIQQLGSLPQNKATRSPPRVENRVS
ncbi:hypothetical protein RHMOL_Rhmol07G0247000 [Rhododendron molle]|uniref:Uncharacterized protein n=1 Tax=Rhododendron molle TaxID=49168 RepID=A0ACC0N4L6_RHOML|nr:hypothetical protein RHMOL_Rhmol07G0247000 [Rhododendron molle]